MQLFQRYRAICIGLLLSVMVTVSSCLEETDPCTSYILFNQNIHQPGWKLSALRYRTNQGIVDTLTFGNVEIYDSAGVEAVILVKIDSKNNFRLTFTRPCIVGKPEYGRGHIIANIDGVPYESFKGTSSGITGYDKKAFINFYGQPKDPLIPDLITLELDLKR